MGQSTKKIIQFNKVTKQYPNGTKGLNNVTFSIEEGEFVFLIGSSGAGKTTVMKHIVKEEMPTQGEIIVAGQKLSEIKSNKIHKLRRKVGYIFQDFKLLNSKSVYENVALSLEVIDKSDEDIRKIVPNLLGLVGLGGQDKKFPSQLSGGEKQRLAIARALAHEPKILLADEPTGNLDRTSLWVVVDLISKINEWGTTIIFGTHDYEIVNALKKRVIHLDKGKIVSDKKNAKYEDE